MSQAKQGGSKQVRKQHFPIYLVKSLGTTIEFTDKFSEAEKAYKDAAPNDKQIFKTQANGSSQCVRRSAF